MSKTRIYIEPGQIADRIRLSDKGLIHKINNVLRLKESDKLYIFDGQGKEYLYSITKAEKKAVWLKKQNLSLEKPLGKRKITLAFPLVREERIDFILQKATEFGVSEFIPFTCQRSLNQKVSSNKLKRWQRIVIEAARQSERLWIPKVKAVTSFQAITESNYPVKIAGAIKGKSLEKILTKQTKDILIVVGPVGDFSPQEFSLLAKSRFKFLKLSSYILRVESAAAFAVGLVNYFLLDDES
jgi:16S rRNA (uracil1498-N3)-methyltransferase